MISAAAAALRRRLLRNPNRDVVGTGAGWSGSAGFIRCLLSIQLRFADDTATFGPVATNKDTLQLYRWTSPIPYGSQLTD